MTSASASRVTRSSRSLRVAVAMFAGVLAVVTVLRAQETPPVREAPPPATSPAGEPVPESANPAETGPAASAAAATEKADAAGGQPVPVTGPTNAPPDPARPVGPTPGRFEPTEKVRADFDVAFPIDI
jgi:hypothetical protein